MNQILVVDDLEDNCLLLQTVLEAEGYQVEVAYSGEDALNIVESNPPDLMLLDVMMPGINGFEVTIQIRNNLELPFFPIVLVTAHRELSIVDGSELGADGFIHKPIEIDELLAKIKDFL